MAVKEIKILRKIFLIFTVIFLLVFFLISEQEDKQAQKDFLKKDFTGIVEDIRYRNLWGYPEYKVNEHWFFFANFFEYSEKYVEIGDSLAKEKGTKKVKVYSKNNKGEWILKYTANKNRIDSLLN